MPNTILEPLGQTDLEESKRIKHTLESPDQNPSPNTAIGKSSFSDHNRHQLNLIIIGKENGDDAKNEQMRLNDIRNLNAAEKNRNVALLPN